jgi:peptidoglycan/LPS O-acetylase OafA/YrhL
VYKKIDAVLRLPQSMPVFITHLTGARFFLSLWVVCNHFVPKVPVTALNHVVSRSNVAVSLFVCMSGFTTHWAYGERDLSEKQEVLRYYSRRIGRVIFTTWIAMTVAIAVMLVTGNPSGHVGQIGHVFRCFAFVETWLHPAQWCPNGQTWTVAALIPSWLLYPWTRRLISGVERRYAGAGLLALAAGAWVLEFGATLILFVAQGFELSSQQHYWTYTWPPSQLLDFFIGATVAALARHHDKQACAADEAEGRAADVARAVKPIAAEKTVTAKEVGAAEEAALSPSHCHCGRHQAAIRVWAAAFTDFGAAGVVIVCCAVPNPGGVYRTGVEVLYNHGVIPVIAAFLYGAPGSTLPNAKESSTTNENKVGSKPLVWNSHVALLLRQPALVGLGTYSFQVSRVCAIALDRLSL